MQAFLIALILSVSPSFAQTFDGHYELLKGGAQCPTGHIQTYAKRMMFGSRHVWFLEGYKEKVEGGCSYESKIKKKDQQIEFVTTRRSCPDKIENGDTLETLQISKDQLTYTFLNTSDSKKNEFKCIYKKVGAK